MYWTFGHFTVFEDADMVLRFEDVDGDVLGYIVAGDWTDYHAMTEDLENNENPIDEGWEDGCGNVISLNGWGNEWLMAKYKKWRNVLEDNGIEYIDSTTDEARIAFSAFADLGHIIDLADIGFFRTRIRTIVETLTR